jgi:hypothetical protein
MASSDASLPAQIVHAISDYRFLTAAQVGRLLQLSSLLVQPILDRLVDGEFLAAIRRPVLHEAQPDTLYALAQRGANQVAADLGSKWATKHLASSVTSGLLTSGDNNLVCPAAQKRKKSHERP